MGGTWSCLLSKEDKKLIEGYSSQLKKASKRKGDNLKRRTGGGGGRGRGSDINNRNYNDNDDGDDDELLRQQQALAISLYQHQMRSSSMRSLVGGKYPPLKQDLPRSVSARTHIPNEPILQPHQLLNQDGKLLVDVKIKHFVLIHGGGYGAWCWYKLIALLEEVGLTATAIDLTGSGIDSTDPNTITSLEHYVRPLIGFLEKLPESEKVILVAHDFGGPCISYAMECLPHRVAKAIFIAAAMVADGQRAFDVFDPQLVTADDLLPRTQSFIYANGNQKSPTAIEYDRTLLKDLLFNQSPAKDVALAAVSLRAIPFAPVLEKLSLTPQNYGQIPRYFVETTEDKALTLAIQKNIVSSNPPERVFRIKGGDHSPFFSKPQGLHRIFLEIAQI